MSTHLTLFPLLKGPEVLTHATIDIGPTTLVPSQSYSVYAQIDVLNFRDEEVKITIKSHPLPIHCWIKLDDYPPTQENKGGGDIHFVYAREFKKWVLDSDTHWETKAVKAYIDQLPDDIPIILWF